MKSKKPFSRPEVVIFVFSVFIDTLMVREAEDALARGGTHVHMKYADGDTKGHLEVTCTCLNERRWARHIVGGDRFRNHFRELRMRPARKGRGSG